MTSSDPALPSTRRRYSDSTYASMVIGGVVLAVGCWSALIWLIFNDLPTVPNRWIFFALLNIAMTGTALPFVQFLNLRFARKGREVSADTLLREAVFISLFVTLCAWLQIPRLLSAPLALILFGALTGIEILLRLRESTRWRPQ
jgi:FtsH-binding integral membrane protein